MRAFTKDIKDNTHLTPAELLHLISILQWQDDSFLEHTKCAFTPLKNKISPRWSSVWADYRVFDHQAYVIDLEFLFSIEQRDIAPQLVNTLNEINNYFNQPGDFIAGAPSELRKLLFSNPYRAKIITKTFFTLLGLGIEILESIQLIRQNLSHLNDLAFIIEKIYYFYSSKNLIPYRPYLIDYLLTDRGWLPYFVQFVQDFKHGLLRQDRLASYYEQTESVSASRDYEKILTTIKDDMNNANKIAASFAKISENKLRSHINPNQISPIIKLICENPGNSEFIINIILMLKKSNVAINYVYLVAHTEHLNHAAEKLFGTLQLFNLITEETVRLILADIQHAKKIRKKFLMLDEKNIEGLKSIILKIHQPTRGIRFFENPVTLTITTKTAPQSSNITN